MVRMKRRLHNAFTLIELLVVVAIIGLLIGILMPSLARARTQTRRAVCAAHLHQVGLAMMAYMQDNRDRMPYISFMPSIGPAPLDTPEPISMADVLGRQLKGQLSALECPSDKPGATERSAPNTGRSFFESEESSYEYRIRLAGRTPAEFDQHTQGGWFRGTAAKPNIAPATIWFARDFENFHGRAGEIGSRRYVYIDGHVSDYEN
jgi:prepilin-type N-terminal cleavage/methylation domain-containing protein